MAKWLIEHNIFEEDLAPLLAEIRRQGSEVVEIKYIPFESGNYDHRNVPRKLRGFNHSRGIGTT